MEGWFAIAGESDDIETLAGAMHFLESGFEIGRHLLDGRQSGGTDPLGVISGFAIEAIERAYFAIIRHKIYPQRHAEAARMNGAENRGMK